MFNDGKIDVVINPIDGPPVLLQNVNPDHHHWVEMKLVGSGKSPRDATCATVYLKANGMRMRQDVLSSGSYISANDRRPHFGLGDATDAGTAEIHWPSGKVENVKLPRRGSDLHDRRRQGNHRRRCAAAKNAQCDSGEGRGEEVSRRASWLRSFSVRRKDIAASGVRRRFGRRWCFAGLRRETWGAQQSARIALQLSAVCGLLLRAVKQTASVALPAANRGHGRHLVGGHFAPVYDAQKRPITAGGFVDKGPVVFEDVSKASGLAGWQHVMGTAGKKYILETDGSGVGLIDYDNDGWLDIYLVNGSTYDALSGKAKAPHAALFHNNHDGTFTDVAAKAGVTQRPLGLRRGHRRLRQRRLARYFRLQLRQEPPLSQQSRRHVYRCGGEGRA